MADRVDDDTPNPGDDEDERLPITAEEMRQRLREVAAGDRVRVPLSLHNIHYFTLFLLNVCALLSFSFPGG
jgi:hypothetical protein